MGLFRVWGAIVRVFALVTALLVREGQHVAIASSLEKGRWRGQGDECMFHVKHFPLSPLKEYQAPLYVKARQPVWLNLGGEALGSEP